MCVRCGAMIGGAIRSDLQRCHAVPCMYASMHMCVICGAMIGGALRSDVQRYHAVPCMYASMHMCVRCGVMIGGAMRSVVFGGAMQYVCSALVFASEWFVSSYR